MLGPSPAGGEHQCSLVLRSVEYVDRRAVIEIRSLPVEPSYDSSRSPRSPKQCNQASDQLEAPRRARALVLRQALNLSLSNADQLAQLLASDPGQLLVQAVEEFLCARFIPVGLTVERIAHDVPHRLGMDDEGIDAVQRLLFVEFIESLEPVDDVPANLSKGFRVEIGRDFLVHLRGQSLRGFDEPVHIRRVDEVPTGWAPGRAGRKLLLKRRLPSLDLALGAEVARDLVLKGGRTWPPPTNGYV